MAKKKVTKKKVIKKKLEDIVDTKYLTQAQLDRICRNDIELHCKNLELDKARLTQQLSAVKYENESMRINESMRLLQKSFNDKIESNSSYMKCLAESHGVDSKWSFQPESGEILVEE